MNTKNVLTLLMILILFTAYVNNETDSKHHADSTEGQMIHHVLLYKFKPGIDRIDEHLETIRAFRGNTEGLTSLECGRNIRKSDGYTHGFIMVFDSSKSLQMYNRSEAHHTLVNSFKDDIEDKFIFDFYSD